MGPSQNCPSRPPQLYKWASDVQREKEGRREKRREERVNGEEQDEEGRSGIGSRVSEED